MPPVTEEDALEAAEAMELYERLFFEQSAAIALRYLQAVFPEGASLETKRKFMKVQSKALDSACAATYGLT